MKRTIYIIRDSVTKKYYTRASCDVEGYDAGTGDIYGGEFEDAIIHTTLSSVREGIKSRVRGWNRRLKDFNPKTLACNYDKWHQFMFEEANKRIGLPACGMEIVAIELDSDGKIIPLKG